MYEKNWIEAGFYIKRITMEPGLYMKRIWRDGILYENNLDGTIKRINLDFN